MAAVGTFVTLFALILVTMFAASIASELRSPWAEPLRFLSVVAQAHELGSGMMDVRHLALHLSASAFLLYSTIKIVEFSR